METDIPFEEQLHTMDNVGIDKKFRWYIYAAFVECEMALNTHILTLLHFNFLCDDMAVTRDQIYQTVMNVLM